MKGLRVCAAVSFILLVMMMVEVMVDEFLVEERGEELLVVEKEVGFLV